MKITRRQLRKIIREAMSDEEILAMADAHLDRLGPMTPEETLTALVRKHAKAHGGRTINDNIADALADPMFRDSGLDERMVTDAIEDFYDEMMGLY